MRAYRIIKKLLPSSGGGDDYEKVKKSIRLARFGCANRPFYHIVVILVSMSTFNILYYNLRIMLFVVAKT